jgi:threonine/homoserine/homoserine lactone efflux protein
MDYLGLVFAGMAIGVVAAAPIGAVNLICIRRTLAFGPVNGFFSGLGAALGDGVFAAITAFGLTYIAQLIEGYGVELQIASGTLLLVFGMRTYSTEPVPRQQAEKETVQDTATSTLWHAIASTFFLTITNPATLLGFTFMFAGLGGLTSTDVNGPQAILRATAAVGGVIAGSALWWFVLTSIIGFFHARIDAARMRAINHLMGIAVSAFGIAVLIHAAAKMFKLI